MLRTGRGQSGGPKHEPRGGATREEAGVSGMMKKLKRRLSWTLKSSRPLDDSLSELAEQLTIEDSSNSNDAHRLALLHHNGKSVCLCVRVCVRVTRWKDGPRLEKAKLKAASIGNICFKWLSLQDIFRI